MNESTMADREILLKAIELWLKAQQNQQAQDKQQKQSTGGV